MNKLLLLLLTIPMLSHSKEIFFNDQGLKIEYSKPTLSCFYDKEAYEGYLNTCLMLPNYEACGQAKYEMHICGNKNKVKLLEEKSK